MGEGVGEGEGVGVGVANDWTRRVTRLVAALRELKWYASVSAVSTASDINWPALPAAAEVTSTSRHTEVDVPGVKLTTVDPFAGRLDQVSPVSVQLLALTFLTLWDPGDPLITNILNLAD